MDKSDNVQLSIMFVFMVTVGYIQLLFETKIFETCSIMETKITNVTYYTDVGIMEGLIIPGVCLDVSSTVVFTMTTSKLSLT